MTDLLAGFAQNNQVLYTLLNERTEHSEVTSLVSTSQYQNDPAFERLQCFDRGIGVRRFGIIVDLNPVDLCDELQSVLDTLEPSQGFCNKGRWGVDQSSCGDGRSDVLKIVSSTKLDFTEACDGLFLCCRAKNE